MKELTARNTVDHQKAQAPAERNAKVTVQVWGRPPVCRFTESLTPCPSGRRNTGPEARLTGRPEVCPTFRPEQLQQMLTSIMDEPAT